MSSFIFQQDELAHLPNNYVSLNKIADKNFDNRISEVCFNNYNIVRYVLRIALKIRF